MTWLLWNSNEDRIRCAYRLIVQTIMMTVLMIIIFIGVTPSIELLDQYIPDTFVRNAIHQTVVAATIILACLFLDRRKISSLGFQLNRRWWKNLAAGLLMGAGMMTLMFLLEYQMGWITLAENDATWSSLLPTLFGWLVLFISVGVVEEVLSRGYHLKNMCEAFSRLGKIPAFLIASVISSGFFALLHAVNPNADLVSTASICLAGLMLCFGRLCTGSLAAPIGLHITWNFFQGPVFGFPISGTPLSSSIIKVKSTTNDLWTGGDFGPEGGLIGIGAIFCMIVMYGFWPRDNSADGIQNDLEAAINDESQLSLNLTQLANFEHRHGQLDRIGTAPAAPSIVRAPKHTSSRSVLETAGS